MPYEQTIETVRRALTDKFSQVDAWFDQPPDVRGFRPAVGWSIDEVLEHVTLTNRFLLLTVGKWTEKAVRRAGRGGPVPDGESDLDRLEAIGRRGSFPWVRPEHMEPCGRPTTEVRELMRRQRDESLACLARLSGGIGALATVRMTTDGLGKIDLYQWLYFLAQHARRHVQQMEAIRSEHDRAAAASDG